MGFRRLCRRPKRGFTLVELLTVCTIISLLASILVPRLWAARDRSAYDACGVNLRNIATALQLYANDNGQQYPPALSNLVPNYLQSLAKCPEASGADTYSPSYQFSQQPSTFTIYCAGSFHVATMNVQPNQPYYYFGIGLGPP